jgi:hypothetical protein
LGDHGLPPHFLLLLLIFVDPNGDVALLLSVLAFLRPVTLPILLSIFPALVLSCLFFFNSEYAHHLVKLGLILSRFLSIRLQRRISKALISVL